MVPINKLHFLRIHNFKYKPLYLTSLMLFFYAAFDGILSFIFPISIEQAGFSKTMIGVIIGSSSVVGAFFDFIISKYIRNTHFRRMFLLMFIICYLTPIILYAAKPLWVFLLASGLWGIYYDLYNFGKFDFISRASSQEGHSASFGLSRIFSSLGYMIAPILAGLAIGELVDLKPYLLMYLMLTIAFIFFCALVYVARKRKDQYYFSEVHKPINFLKEIHIWERIGKLILPLLILTLLLNVFDSFFWTIGPLLSESENFQGFNGLFITLYELPTLLVGWFIGNITVKFGKKRTAFIAFIAGSLLLSTFPFIQNPLGILSIIFLSALCIAISWPSINGAYADYISEARSCEAEIEALDDFFTNLGYVVGPISAGILADNIGNQNSFTVLGLAGALVAFIMWKRTPKKITIEANINKL